jgi:hypothetical protein
MKSLLFFSLPRGTARAASSIHRRKDANRMPRSEVVRALMASGRRAPTIGLDRLTRLLYSESIGGVYYPD